MHASPLLALPDRSTERTFESVQLDGKNQLGFENVYQTWFHEVCRWSRALGGLNADVEDIAQEVFLVVRRKLDDFDGQHLRAWLYRITQRTVSDYRRRAWFRRVVRPAAGFLNQLVDPADGPREIVQKREVELHVGEVLDKMSAVRRTAFILFEIEGYSGEEIADLEQISVATVYTRLHHARKDFFKQIARRGFSGEGHS